MFFGAEREAEDGCGREDDGAEQPQSVGRHKRAVPSNDSADACDAKGAAKLRGGVEDAGRRAGRLDRGTFQDEGGDLRDGQCPADGPSSRQRPTRPRIRQTNGSLTKLCSQESRWGQSFGMIQLFSFLAR